MTDQKAGRKWLTKENVTFFMALTAFLWAGFTTPLTASHFVLHTTKGEVFKTKLVEDGDGVYEWYFRFRMENLGDKSIKINQFFLGVPGPTAKDCDTSVMGITPEWKLENDGFIPAGESLAHEQPVHVPINSLPETICIAVIWQDHGGRSGQQMTKLAALTNVVYSETLQNPEGKYFESGDHIPLIELQELTYCVSMLGRDFCP